jgi:hypothetical protein
MKTVGILLVVVACLGLGASTVQAQCCGNVSYASYYVAPSCASGSCCATGGCSTCATPYYSSYAPAYTSYYNPYYTVGYGWGGGTYSVGYGGWRGGCCGGW